MASAKRHSIEQYDPHAPLSRASTPPATWYTSDAIAQLEHAHVFGGTWQAVAGADQVKHPGAFVTANIAGQPLVVVRGDDDVLRAFYNVCRHHAAEVVPQACGQAAALRCPYHSWTYGLDGALKNNPEFDGVEAFDKANHGLVPVHVKIWESFVFVCLADDPPDMIAHLGDLAARAAKLNLGDLQWVDRRVYELQCNWKVFVDNYLDGGYHVPFIHQGLGSVLSHTDYTIEACERFCQQSSPIERSGADQATSAVRGGDRAYYYWLYPNFMFNWYEGYMDTHIILPLAVDRCQVIFDFYFTPPANDRTQSIAIADQIQFEDIDICESVQRGLTSRAYDIGRLSVRREAGEHLFHRLLYADLHAAVA